MIVNKTVVVTPDLSVDTDAYTDGDVVGGLLDITDLCGGGGGGTIRQILLTDAASLAAVYELYIFDGKPTDIADDAAFASNVVIADLNKLVAVVDIAATDYVTINSLDYALLTDQRIAHGTGQLWCYLVLNGSTPNYTAATDLTLKFTGWLD